jgi:hypothetical protein
MPDSCSECRFKDYVFTTGVTWCGANCVVLARNFEAIGFDGRPEWCPLVDLGKHGDLIDRGAFKADYGMKDNCADCEKEMHGKVKACEYDRIYSKMDFCGWLDDADVVIEAEGEG